MGYSRAATEEDLARLLVDFETSGRLAVEAGFDAVEVHLGHGYLLSQFLSPGPASPARRSRRCAAAPVTPPP